jgi:hypothetical protein
MVRAEDNYLELKGSVEIKIKLRHDSRSYPREILDRHQKGGHQPSGPVTVVQDMCFQHHVGRTAVTGLNPRVDPPRPPGQAGIGG